jgi:RYK receptor-like tyrosine kinase
LVHNGVLNVTSQMRRNIFVKTVTDHASPDHIEVMLRECCTFKHGVEHMHVLPLCAIVLDEGSPMAIYPQTSYGNLKLYLRQLGENRHNDALSTRDVVGMAIQILHGLQYIVKKKLEFSDLATRNCYLDEGLTVKISDNALARDIFPEDYQCLGDNVNRPIKWLAIEAISKYIYSPASDVWSFGITLWELWTLADQPYMDIDPFEMVSFLKEGGRLYQPSNCPDPLYRCMCCCWAYDAAERPTISKLIKYLEEFYRTLGAFF